MITDNTHDSTKLLNINEVSELLGISTRTLKRWEEKGRIKPQRTPGNQRRYVAGDVHRLMQPPDTDLAAGAQTKITSKIQQSKTHADSITPLLAGILVTILLLGLSGTLFMDAYRKNPVNPLAALVQSVNDSLNDFQKNFAAFFDPYQNNTAADNDTENGSSTTSTTNTTDETKYDLDNIAFLSTKNLEVSNISSLNILNAADATFANLLVTNTVELPNRSITNLMLANPEITYIAGSGLSGGGTVALGGTATFNIGAGRGINVWNDDIEVIYGDQPHTAVEGNKELVLTTDSNITGGKNITLGNGGEFHIGIKDDPFFETSVTTPLLFITGASDLRGSIINSSSNNSGRVYVDDDLEVTGTIYGTISGSVNPGLTIGSVLFQGASGIAEDNANFFWEDTNNRLGIGTTVPLHSLSVIGDASTSTVARFEQANFGSFSQISIANTAAASTANLSGASFIVNSDTAARTAFRIDASLSNISDAVRDSLVIFKSNSNGAFISALTINGNNIGIGTTTPSSLFSVGSTSQFQVNSTGAIAAATGITSSGTVSFSGLGSSSTEDTLVVLNASNQLEQRELSDILSDNNVVDGIGNTNRVAYWTDVNTLAADDDFFFDGTSVGIGTTTPSLGTKLHVFNAGAGSQVRIETNVGFDPSLRLVQDATVRGVFGYDDSDDLIKLIYNNSMSGANGIVINSSGNIGIGTTVPEESFHISRSGSSTRQLIDSYGGTPQISGRRAGGTSVSPTAVIAGNTLLLLAGRGFDGTAFSGTQGSIAIAPDENWNSTSHGSRITFSTVLNGTTTEVERLRINNAGNIGIGTITPTSFKLEVAGNVGPEADNTRDLGSAIRRWANIYGTTINATTVNATTFAGAITPTGFTQGSVVFAGTGGTLTQDNSNFFFDDTNNRLGIGTTEPGTSLDIVGGTDGAENNLLKLRSSGVGSTATTIRLVNSTVANSDSAAEIVSTRVVNGSQLDFRTSVNGTAAPLTRLSIDRNGNVGIGTSSPSTKLDVTTGSDYVRIAPGASTPLDIFTSADNPDIRIQSGLSSTGIAGLRLKTVSYEFRHSLNESNGQYQFRDVINGNNVIIIESGTGTHNAIRVKSTGNVGIGLVNPSSFRLEVAGNVGPEADNTRDLGSAIRRWANIYGTNIITTSLSGAITPTGFTQGSVAFAGSGGTLTQDNSNFFFDDANNRLGIGTTSPSASLHVNGIIRSGLSGGATGRVDIVSSNGVLWNLDSANGSNLTLSHNAGSVSNFIINSTNGVNVGIGTTAPNEKLQIGTGGAVPFTTDPNVAAQISSTTEGDEVALQLYVNEGTNQRRSKYFIDDTTGFWGFDVSATTGIPDFVIQRAGTTQLFVGTSSSNGNVGIGTTAPDSSLTIQSATGNSVISFKNSAGTSQGYLGVVNNTGGLFTTSAANDTAIRSQTNLLFGINNVEHMRIGSSGNVGIGTTSPSTALVVQKAAGTLANDNISGPTVTLQSSTAQAVGAGSAIGFAGDTDGLATANRIFAGIGGFKENATSSNQRGYLALYTHPSNSGQLLERMRINSDGNVGIGTTVPETKLHVSAGNILLDNTQAIQFKDSGGVIRSILQYSSSNNLQISSPAGNGSILYGISNSTGDHIFNVNSGAEAMRIIESGNVGIGTTGPLSKLDVAEGDLTLSSSTAGDASEIGSLVFHSSSGGASGNHAAITGYREIAGAGSLIFKTKLSGVLGEVARFNSSGNLGIGTNSPGADLDLARNNRAIGATLRLTNSANSSSWVTGDIIGSLEFHSTDLTNPETLAWMRAISEEGASRPDDVALIFATTKDATINDATERMRIDSSGNVGVGTTAPAQRLTVRTPDINNDGIFLQNETGTNVAELSTFGGSGNRVGSLRLRDTSSTQNVLLTGNPNVANYINSGNVGIGTTAPGALLSLGSSTANTKLALWDNGAGSFYGLGVQSNQFRLHLPSSAARFSFLASSSGGELFTLLGSGNVGIGTTGPSGLLHVSEGANDTVADVLITGGTIIGSFENAYANLWFGNQENAGYRAAGIQGIAGGDFSAISWPSHLAFLTTPDDSITAQERLRITDAGNVGIGTTAPSEKLHLQTTAGGTIYSLVESTSTSTNAIAGYRTQNDGGASATLRIFGTGYSSAGLNQANFASLVSSSSTAGLILTTQGTGDPLILGTADTERMRIDGNGNVGIGITNPVIKLQVGGGGIQTDNGSIKAILTGAGIQDSLVAANNQAAAANTGSAIAFSGTLSANLLGRISAAWDDAAVTDAYLRFDTKTAGTITERLRITSTGNVGIGTTAPGSLLTVSGNGQALTVGDGSNVASYINFAGTRSFIGYDGTNTTIQGGPTKGIKFNVNNSTFGTGTAMTIDATGNVGIGDTAPSRKLTVNGDFRSYTAGLGDLTITHSGLVSSVLGASSVQLALGSNGSEAIRINTSGNVGIGTTTPAAKLDSLSATEQLRLSYNTSNFSSFVTNSVGDLTITPSGVDATFAARSLSIASAQSGAPGVFLSIANTDVSGKNWRLRSGANGTFDIRNESDLLTQLSITPAGNVGIGTATPASKLTVLQVADMTLTSSQPTGLFENQLTAANGTAVDYAAALNGVLRITTSAGNPLTQSDSGYNNIAATPIILGDGTLDSFAGINSRGLYYGGTIGQHSLFRAGRPTDLSPGTATITNLYGLRIDALASPGFITNAYGIYQAGASDTNYFAGNVGIGTSTPYAPLTVRSTNVGGYAEGINLDINDATTGSAIGIDFNTSSTDLGAIPGARIQGIRMNSGAPTDLVFSTRGSNVLNEIIRITNTGLVGIGTTSPAQLLHVQGNAQLGTSGTGDRDLFLHSSVTGQNINLQTRSSYNALVSNNTPFVLSAVGSNAFIVHTNGVERMRISGAGNFGLGTNLPTYRSSTLNSVSTAGSAVSAITNTNTTDSANTVTLRLNTGAVSTTTNARFITFYADCTTENCAGTAVGNISLNNGNVAYNTGGADFAERFYVNETTEAGDVIGVNDSINRKSVTGDKILGVVSDNAGFIGNSPEGVDKNTNPAVGLLGQIRTKVTGNIKKGDLVTVSQTPGVAQRATHAGEVLGTALEDHPSAGSGQASEDVGKILVLVRPGWYNPQMAMDTDGTIINKSQPSSPEDDPLFAEISQKEVSKEGEVSKVSNGDDEFNPLEFNSRVATSSALTDVRSQISDLRSSDESHTSDIIDLKSKIASLEADLALFASGSALLSDDPYKQASTSAELGLEELEASSLTLTDDLSVGGRTTLSDVGITGSVNIGLIAIEGLDENGFATINTTAGPLKLQSDGLHGVDILDGKVVITPEGNMTVDGTVTVKKLEIDTDDTAGASAGVVTIEEGQTEIEINTSALSENSLIFVTPERPVAVGALRKENSVFTIKLESAPSSDLKVNWWIIN